MTEHDRVVAEYRAWCKTKEGQTTDSIGDIFAAGWLAAKEDTKRLQREVAPEQKPLPTFDEWFQDKYACGFEASVYARKGLPYDQAMLLLSKHLREYVTEIARRR